MCYQNHKHSRTKIIVNFRVSESIKKKIMKTTSLLDFSLSQDICSL